MKILLLCLLAACHGITNLEIAQQEGAVPMVAPAWYATEWARMEACSGLSGDFGSVAWYVTPKLEIGDVKYWGVYLPRNNVIILRDVMVASILTVDHEEMHALLRGGLVEHPVQYFNGVCGNLL